MGNLFHSFFKIYTIGCSNRSQDELLTALKKYSIQVVVDVRSVPYSSFTPQFNQEPLRKLLTDNKIIYISFANEFGARRIENSVYINNTVDFNKVSQLDIFKKGVDRVLDGLKKGYVIALMCTEYNPIDCHRFSMVSRAFSKIPNISITHILNENKCISNEELEEKMLNEFKLQPELFETKEQLIDQAYKKLENRIAFHKQ